MADEMFVNSPTVGSDAPIATLSGNGGSISSSATTWHIASALPSAQQVSGYQFHAIITERPGDPDSPGEAVIIPTQSGTTLTGITRAASPQSTAQSWPDGTSIYPVETAEAFENAPGLATAIATFSNVSTAQTLNSFASYPLQKVNLTGNPTITLPAGPSGKWCTGTIEFVQDATGGRTWGYSGSVQQPGGAQVPAAGANGSDLTSLLWDGSQWWVLPVTSGPVVISILGMLIEGGASGLGYVRVLGGQAGGSAPAYTPNTSYLEIVPDTGLSGGFGFWYSPVGSTSWTSWTGGAGGSGVVVSSPANFDMPGYNQSATDWVGLTPRYYDITAAPFNVSTGSSDNTYAINFALYTLGQLGITAFLPMGVYNVATAASVNSSGVPVPHGTSGATVLNSVITIGNANTGGNTTANQNFTGPADSVSTWTASFEGATPMEGQGGSINAALAETRILWTGGTGFTGVLLNINGPIVSPSVKNIKFDGNSTYANSAQVPFVIASCRRGWFQDLTFANVQKGGVVTSVVCANATAVNCCYNTFTRVQVVTNGSAAAKFQWGLILTDGVVNGTDPGPTGNSCYNRFHECSFSASGYDVVFQGCDTNTFYDVAAHFLCYDFAPTCLLPSGVLPQGRTTGFTNGSSWPAGNKILSIEQGGTTPGATNLGTPATSAGVPNEVHFTNAVNGITPNPYLPLLKWCSENLVGLGTLSAGVFTLPSWLTNFTHNVLGGSSACYLKAHYTGLAATTPGAVGVLVPVMATNGSTATITSYNGGVTPPTVNTADNNGIVWELVYS